jgi:hypothetical protein
MKGEVADQVILYYLVNLQNRQYSFYTFCDQAYIKGTDNLFFGKKGSDQRRDAQYRLKTLRDRLKNRKIYLQDQFKLEVSCCVTILLEIVA